MFGTAAMRAAFGELAFLARCAEVEAALARAQARLGIVPADAAAAISTAVASRSRPNPEALDLARLKRETETVGYPILPLVRQLAERAGEAGRWLHWGATTQDIMDTAAVLQMRDGLALIESRSDGAARPSRRARPALARHADGRAHPSAARPADHLRLQGGGVARRVRPPCGAARRAEAAGADGAVRRRRRDARFARRGRGGAASRPSWRASWASPSRRSPGMSRATRSPRPCSSSRWSAAASARSRST